MFEYFQDDEKLLQFTDPVTSANYLDHLSFCLINPSGLENKDFNSSSCLAGWGGIVWPYTALGGFLPDGGQINSETNYKNATALVMVFILGSANNYSQEQDALAWENA